MLSRTYFLKKIFKPDYETKGKSFEKANDFYKISFENVVANAFNLEPLRRYYFFCNKSDFRGNIGKYTSKKSEN